MINRKSIVNSPNDRRETIEWNAHPEDEASGLCCETWFIKVIVFVTIATPWSLRHHSYSLYVTIAMPWSLRHHSYSLYVTIATPWSLRHHSYSLYVTMATPWSLCHHSYSLYVTITTVSTSP